ncbi:MAG: 50S ribosomal protein L35 [Candidatus Omnitrophica bacterium]|nr:50S ribosomal protein L35 [Candidatus Omnitrophota bacterium]
MPKLKTRKAVAKRVTVSKKGKAMMAKAFKGHLLTSKNRKRKRRLKQRSTATKANSAKIRGMVPYS